MAENLGTGRDSSLIIEQSFQLCVHDEIVDASEATTVEPEGWAVDQCRTVHSRRTAKVHS
jgi:hypothetical protein